MIAIKVCPSTLRSGFDVYSPSAVKDLFDGVNVSPYLDFDFDDEKDQRQAIENMHNISISGVQEKFSAVVANGTIRLSRNGEQATHILKPAPYNFNLYARKQIPANEHLTMQIASQIYDIHTAKNGLCFGSSGQPIYITKRFDVEHGSKNCIQEDFASITGMTEQGSDSSFKYNGSYSQIADAIRRYVPAWMPHMEQFFKIVLFCYIYGNEDAHMKNFSLVNKDGEYMLAPAYDLMNTCLHTQSGSDFALKGGLSTDIEQSDVFYKTGHPCRLDFERFAERIALPRKRATQVLDMFMEIPSSVDALIDLSFLDDKMKRIYKRIINERIHRFIRKSE